MGNDEPPYSSASSSYAHQKLVIAFDPETKTGFYLLHSVPSWPYPDNLTNYDNHVYSQHHFCMNIDEEGLNILGTGLYVSRPKFYVSQYDEEYLSQVAPDLLLIAQGKYSSDVLNDTVRFKTAGGQEFQYFYKSGKSGLDIYADMIAPYYKEDIIAETWLRDSSMVPYCGEYSVEMAQYVIFNEQEFKETQDHCKWCVSKNDAKFACFGDMNFQTSQKSRGGSSMCFEDETFAQVMLNTIESLNPTLMCEDVIEY